MKNLYSELPNGYQESIQKGLGAMRYFSRNMSFGAGTEEERIGRLKKEIESADAIVIGAGAGLSTAAGLTYSGERFERYFFDYANRYGIRDIYSGGFYPFPDEETRWAWWARHIYYNRYIDAPKPVYGKLLNLIKDRDYFAITTNVDHQFQRAGFDKKRLFYTQGDYGLFQSVNPSLQKTYDNEEWVMKAMEAQGFVKDADGVYQVPEDGRIAMRIPSDLIPKCPDDGSGVTMNLRADVLLWRMKAGTEHRRYIPISFAGMRNFMYCIWNLAWEPTHRSSSSIHSGNTHRRTRRLSMPASIRVRHIVRRR